MTPKDFKKLCRKHKVKLSQLPAFPSNEMTDSQWINLIELLSKNI
jgi:L-asparaginase/Glu-tRNA(Gln) amidotransferase subunit D